MPRRSEAFSGRRIQPLHRAIQRRSQAFIGQFECGLGHTLHRLDGGLDEAVHQALFHSAQRGGGQLGQNAGVQPQGDGGDSGQHDGAEAAPHPFAYAQGSLHHGEDLAAHQQGQGQRGGGSGGIGQQQQGGPDARPLQRRAGQHQPQDRPGAGSPEQSGGDAQQERRAGSGLAGGLGRFRQAGSGGDQRVGQAFGQLRQQQGQAE